MPTNSPKNTSSISHRPRGVLTLIMWTKFEASRTYGSLVILLHYIQLMLFFDHFCTFDCVTTKDFVQTSSDFQRSCLLLSSILYIKIKMIEGACNTCVKLQSRVTSSGTTIDGLFFMGMECN